MIDDEFMIPNDNARIYFPEWFENEKSPEMSDTISIGNTMVIDRIMNESGLSSLLDSIFDDDSSLIKDVMQYMIIGETTAIQHFPSFMRRIPVFSKQIYSDSSIGRLLKDRIKFRDTDLFLKSWNNMHKGDAIYISYDSTNMNTYSEGIEIAELGHAKDDDEVPIVNMSYSIDQKNGTPLFYETYMGSIIDNSQLTYMVDRAKEYGYENIGLILDRGYFSARNIRYIEKKGYDLIMMVKTNQKKISELITRHRLSIANQIDAYIEKYEIYGKTVKAKLYDDEKEYYVHIYYDGEKANEQRSMLLNSYAKLERDLEKEFQRQSSTEKKT
ncbi:transposase [Allocoprobacillus halotolerans]|nr:transposase [Allocoprobacillus halotolerans]UTY39880.1 transposase [Allocoprobacillus halotolerans]